MFRLLVLLCIWNMLFGFMLLFIIIWIIRFLLFSCMVVSIVLVWCQLLFIFSFRFFLVFGIWLVVFDSVYSVCLLVLWNFVFVIIFWLVQQFFLKLMLFSVCRLVVCGMNCLLLVLLIIGRLVLIFSVSYCWLLLNCVLLCNVLVMWLVVLILVISRKCLFGCLNYSRLVVFLLIIGVVVLGKVVNSGVSVVCVWKLVIFSRIRLLLVVMVILEKMVYFFSLVSCVLCRLWCLIYVKLFL